MRISAISWVALGASLGAPPLLHARTILLTPPLAALFQGVQAAPIRVTVVTHQEWTGSSSGGAPEGAVFRFGHAMAAPVSPGFKKTGCRMRPSNGGRPSVGDAIRHALGLPPVEHEHHHGHHQAPPPPLLLKPVLIAPAHQESGIIRVQAPQQVTTSEEPFLRRVHAALLTLGKWEARAVAFVLGA
jgi:hypothetical protein